MNADIVLLQETHLKASNLSVIKISKFQTQFLAPGSSKSRGVVILVANSLRFYCHQPECDPLGQYIFAKGMLERQTCTIGSIYAPNVRQLPFLEETLLKLSHFQEGHVIIGWDFNYVADLVLDKRYSDSPMKANTTRRHLTKLKFPLGPLLVQFNLTDAWRHCNPSSKEFTFFSSRHNSFSRKDFVLVSPMILHHVQQTKISVKLWCDRAPVFCSIN